MSNHIKILHLEDLATDAELVRRELLKGDLSFEIQLVQSKAEFIEALDRFTPDIILSDHSLPGFDSLGALSVLRKRQIRIPFILVTSTTSEEVAVNIMKAGAWDYVLKDRMGRLSLCISNALEKWQSEKEKEIYYEQVIGNEKRFRGMIENSYDIVTLTNENFDTLYRSPSATRITGWEGDDLGEVGNIGRPHPEDMGRLNLTIEEVFSHPGQSFPLSFRIRHKLGHYLWIEGVITNMVHDPAIRGIISNFRDVTQQRQQTTILKEYSDRHEIVSKATNDAIWDWDVESDLEIWNHGTETLFGYKEREVSSSRKWWKEKLHPEDYDRVNKELTDCFNKKSENWISEYQYLCADGNYKHVLNRAYILYQDDRPVRMIGAMQDVTEVTHYRQDLEQLVDKRTSDLNEALNKEKDLVELKSKFISIASHEFRTPLSTIAIVCGFLRKHREKLDASEFEKKLANIEKQVKHMSYLLDDILTHGKSEAGKIQTQLSVINIREFFEQVCVDVEQNSKTHSIRMFFLCTAVEFSSDEKLLRNIVINLLTNAIKFSPDANSISVRIFDMKDHLTFEVEDQGIGIAIEDQENVFSSFSRGSNVTNIPGTGLGLSIVKKAVDLLGGSIKFKSELQKGTRFTVVLPIL